MTHVAVAALTVLCFGSPALAQTVASGPPTIVTQGEATLKRAPDRAWVMVSTETRDSKAAEARRRNAEAMTAVQAALKGTGVRSDALRTTGYSLSPEFDWISGRSVLRGYVVRNQIEVRVDDLDRLSDVLDAVNSSKNVAISLQGLRFDLRDEKTVQNEALRLAVEAALSRAQAIAAGARRSVGQIIRIEEHNVGPILPRPIPMMRTATSGQAAEAATPISPGEIEVRVQVTLTVEIR